MLVLTLKGDVEDHALVDVGADEVDVGADEVDVDNFDVDMWWVDELIVRRKQEWPHVRVAIAVLDDFFFPSYLLSSPSILSPS